MFFQKARVTARYGVFIASLRRYLGFGLGLALLAAAPATLAKSTTPSERLATAKATANNNSGSNTSRTTQQKHKPLTLSATWEKAKSHLLKGEQAEALSTLDQLAEAFSEEPEYVASLPQVLPLHARLCLLQGRAADAERLYQQWLALNLPATNTHAEVWDGLAIAKEQLGDYHGAITASQSAAESTSDTFLRQYSRLRIANLYALAGEGATAMALFETLASDEAAPMPLRIRAQLQALWLASDSGLNAEANRLLLAFPWPLTQMPELAELSTLAQRSGDIQLEAGNPEAALLAYDFVVPPRELLASLYAWREQLSHALETQQAQMRIAGHTSDAALRFLSEQLAAIDNQLKSLEAATLSHPLQLFYKACAYLKADRADEAAALFSAIASAPTEATDAKTAQLSALYHLLALRQAGREGALQSAADALAIRYHGSETAAQAMLLKAESLRRSSQFSEAIKTLDTLLQKTWGADSDSQQRSAFARILTHAHLERGYTNGLLGRYGDAHGDFTAAQATAASELPEMRRWAEYWIGQNHLLAADYPAAASAFSNWLAVATATAATANQPTTQPHEAEDLVLFAHAQATYAINDFTAALQSLRALATKQNQTQPLQAMASLLHAEVLVASAKVPEAEALLSKFASDTSPEPWRTQALLRHAQIAHHSGRNKEAVLRYLQYAEHAQVTQASQARVTLPIGYATAISRAAQILAGEGNETSATVLLAEALAAAANNTSASDIMALFSQAHALGVAPSFTGSTSISTNAKGNVTDTNRNTQPYSTWLQSARQHALSQQQQTAYARLSLELAALYTRSGRSDLADALRLQVAHAVDTATLDDQALADLAVYLNQKDSTLAATFIQALQRRSAATQQQRAPAALQLARAFAALHAGDAQAAMEQSQALDAAWPLHPLREQSLLLQAQAATSIGKEHDAMQAWQTLLTLPQANAYTRANALIAIARHHRAEQQLPAAIHYYQRVYTLHRGNPQALAIAYLESAPLFEALGDARAALATYEEMLAASLPEALPAEQLHLAQQHRARLLAKLAQSSENKEGGVAEK